MTDDSRERRKAYAREKLAELNRLEAERSSSQMFDAIEVDPELKAMGDALRAQLRADLELMATTGDLPKSKKAPHV